MSVEIIQAYSNIYAGGDGTDGDLVLKSRSDQERIKLDADGASGCFGGNGEEGEILLFPAKGDNKTSKLSTIHLNGGTGDIILRNADCAEDFPVINPQVLEPGTVVAISEDGRLSISNCAYNKRVAGVVAGARKLRPGIILGRTNQTEVHLPVALMGRVYCKTDASYGAVEVGDLLTSAPTPGYAMKVSEPSKALGTVIGKALHTLKSGQDMIPILVALQ